MFCIYTQSQADLKDEGFAPFVNSHVAQKAGVAIPPHIEVFFQKTTSLADQFRLESMANSVLESDRQDTQIEWLWLDDGRLVVILIHNPSPYIKFNFKQNKSQIGVLVEYTNPPY